MEETTMPWVLIPGALQALRRAKHYDVKTLAELSGLAPDTIYRLESRIRPPDTPQEQTINQLCQALECKPETFVRCADAAELHQLRRARPVVAARRAARPSRRGRPRLLTLPSGTYECVDSGMLKRCALACATFEGRRLAVTGTVEPHDAMPELVARVLDAQPGAGVCFRIWHRHERLRRRVSVPVYTRQIEHTRQIMDYANIRKAVSVIVRVVVRFPKTDWQGFPIFGKTRPPVPYAFVVDEIAP
jgi:transcriptional regulator with XRE-family HTH domain